MCINGVTDAIHKKNGKWESLILFFKRNNIFIKPNIFYKINNLWKLIQSNYNSVLRFVDSIKESWSVSQYQEYLKSIVSNPDTINNVIIQRGYQNNISIRTSNISSFTDRFYSYSVANSGTKMTITKSGDIIRGNPLVIPRNKVPSKIDLGFTYYKNSVSGTDTYNTSIEIGVIINEIYYLMYSYINILPSQGVVRNFEFIPNEYNTSYTLSKYTTLSNGRYYSINKDNLELSYLSSDIKNLPCQIIIHLYGRYNSNPLTIDKLDIY